VVVHVQEIRPSPAKLEYHRVKQLQILKQVCALTPDVVLIRLWPHHSSHQGGRAPYSSSSTSQEPALVATCAAMGRMKSGASPEPNEQVSKSVAEARGIQVHAIKLGAHSAGIALLRKHPSYLVQQAREQYEANQGEAQIVCQSHCP